MKDIRIFVASSKELERERNYLAFLVLAKADEFERRGFRVRLSKWEYVDPKMTKERTEDRYLAEMYACDAALILFRNVAGMYTREEMDKALATEQAGTERLKAHRILFSEGADGNSDAAKLRASLPEGSYGTFRDFSDLREGFLALVERVAAMDDLVEVDESGLRTVSAFLAADDELAADRDAFADMVLNLNDILARRGVRVKLRFYDSARHREMLEFSEMALVLYRTNFNAFGPEQMREAYDRTKREENPRRLYVFFRDGDDITSDEEFAAFRDGFAENIGHFFCRFENADTLKLNFLLSLENALGEGASFVKLDGQRVMADGLEVGDLTNLPMVAKNKGLSSIMAELDALGAKFAEQRRRCNEDPLNDTLYGELMDLSVRKNELQQQVDRELSLSLSLAKRMAAISVAEANDTIMRARAKMEEGRIKEAIEILDGASSSLRRRRILRRAEERVDEVAQEIKELAAGNEVEFFRVEAVMSYTGMPFNERFKKSESIYSMLAEDIEAYSESCPSAHKLEVDAMLADILRRFAKLYDEVGDSLSPIPLLEKAGALYKSVEDRGGRISPFKRIAILSAIASAHESNNQLSLAEEEYGNLLQVVRKYSEENGGKGKWRLANTLESLSRIHVKGNHLEKAREEALESLGILQSLEDERSEAGVWNILSSVYKRLDAIEDARRCFANAIQIIRDRLPAHPVERYLLAGTLFNYGQFLNAQNEDEQAEVILKESLSLWREEIAQNPIKYADYLCGVLNELAIVYNYSGRTEDARGALEECVQVDRRNAVQNPDRFLPDLQVTLFNLGVLLEDNDQNAAAQYYEESLSICRKIAKANPSRYDRRLVEALSGYGDFIEKIGDVAKAEALYREGLEMAHGIVDRGGKDAIRLVATALNDIAWLHQRQKDLGEAEKYFEELLEIRRELAVKNPQRYNTDVACTLGALGDLLKDLNRLDEAEKMYMEALGIRRRLAVGNPAKFEGVVASTLHGIGLLKVKMADIDAAREYLLEALEIRTRLAAQAPEKFQKALEKTKAELAKLEAIGR